MALGGRSIPRFHGPTMHATFAHREDSVRLIKNRINGACAYIRIDSLHIEGQVAQILNFTMFYT